MLKSKGFSLVELILVIAIIGILVVSALPRFLNISAEAMQSSRDGAVGAIRSGIMMYRGNQLATTGIGSFPATLDAVPNNTACSTGFPCFTNVLESGVEDDDWFKVNQSSYIFNSGGDSETTYAYNSVDGSFNPAP